MLVTGKYILVSAVQVYDGVNCCCFPHSVSLIKNLFTFLKELSSSLREEGKSLLSSFIFDISMQDPPPVSQWLFLDLQRNRTYLFCAIDLFHNGSQIKYSSVLILISLSILATTSKFQKNICFKMRAVGLININATECKGGCHL